MELSLKVFETAVRQGHAKVAQAGSVDTADTQMVNDLFTYGSKSAKRSFERSVARIYRRKTGKQLTGSITVAALVAFIVAYWSEILVALKVIMFLFQVRKFRKEMSKTDGPAQ